MKTKTFWKICLGTAGVKGLLMALFHFFLPYQWNWDEKLMEVPQIFPWALGVFNFSWSLMLLLLSAIVLHIAVTGPKRREYETSIIFGLGVYWLIHAAYLFVYQPPLPPAIEWLKLVLLAFPVIVGFLHLLPLWLLKNRGL